MKFLKVFVLALAIVFGSNISADAQFRFGVKAGVNVNSMKFSKSLLDSDNQAGFVGGLTTQFTMPVIGVGFDLSALYVRRNAKFMQANEISKDKRDYIEIPLNLRWNIGIPGLQKLFSPYITTGPSVAFLTSHTRGENYRNKATDWAWNFGLGFQIIDHIQIGASYGLGMTKAVNHFTDGQAAHIDGKNRYWTITAAYLF